MSTMSTTSDDLDWNIALLNEELFETKPNPKILVNLFVCILNSVLSHTESNSHQTNLCQCHNFIQTHRLNILERNIQNYASTTIQTNPNSCWIMQMSDKYGLLKQMYLRIG